MSTLRLGGLSVVSIVYLLFAFLMLGLILRKHLCIYCYYYGRLCGMGWGKLSSCLFKEKSGNYELGMKLAGLTWGLLTVIPISSKLAELDVLARKEVYTQIIALSKTKIGQIVISSDLDELFTLSHNIMIMRNGKIVACLNTKDVTPDMVLGFAYGGKND